MNRVDTHAFIIVDGVKKYGRVRDRWLKDLDKDELSEMVLRLTRELDAEREAHEETVLLAAGRGCAG